MVELRYPDAVHAVLDALDVYVEQISDAKKSVARERIEQRRANSPDARLVHARVKSGVPLGSRKLSREERDILCPPSVRWEFVNDHPDEPMLGAARYDVNSQELIINADWRAYVELRDWTVAHADLATLPAERVWTIVAEEWSRGLSEIVMYRRYQAFQDGLLDRIGGYLSEDALTTAMSSGAPMKSVVAHAVHQRTERARRRQREKLARLAAAE